MSFFEQQRVAKRNSSLLYVLFLGGALILSVINTYVIGYAAMLLMHRGLILKSSQSHFVGVFLINLAVFIVFIVMSKKNAESGVNVAKMLGGRLLQFPFADPNEKMLFNVVEEMSIASGLPTPFIFVLDHEDSINAFAAGIDRKSFSVAVTKGALDYLSREELQAVIGHEFSHILNDDMSTNAELTGVVTAFMMFMRLGRSLLNGRNTISRRSNFDILGVVLLILGSIGFVIGRFIQSMFSREREYLADAASAQYTRNPAALAKALAKIKVNFGSAIRSANSYDYAHIFFAEGVSSFFSTHPPIERRIQQLVPGVPIANLLQQASHEIQSQEEKREAKEIQLDPLSAVKTAPDLIQDMISAKAVLYAVLLKNQDQNVQKTYFGFLESYSKDLHLKTQAYLRNLENHPKDLTMYLKKSLGILRMANEQERNGLIKLMEQIYLADQKWTWLEGLMFELAQEVLIRQGSSTKKVAKFNRLQDVRESFTRVLFWAATNGEGTANIDPKFKRAAIQRLAVTIPVFVGVNPDQINVPAFQSQIAQTDFENLYQLNRELRAKVIQALAIIHKADKPLEPWEFESMRLTCLILNVPPPALLGDETVYFHKA